MKYLLALIVMCLSQFSFAGSVYKCQTASGMIYQQSPCAANAKKVAVACTSSSAYSSAASNQVSFAGQSCEDKAMAASKLAEQARKKRESEYKQWQALPEPSIGMSQSQVMKSRWGDADKINTTITANGKSEQWVYDDFGYLYFDNGILRTIQKR